MRWWTSAALAFVVFAAVGCRAPVAVVSVEDPFAIGDDVVELKVGNGPGDTTAVPRPAGRAFPLSVAVNGPDGERREVYVEAVDGSGTVLASGETIVTFRRYGEELAVVQLRPPCVSDDECINATWCDGVESCEDGRCQVGTSPCGSGDAHACVQTTECIEEEQDCVATVDHGLCPSEYIDGIEVQTYCDVVKGCTEGVPCTIDADCDDGSVCNGQESCEDHHCIRGVPEQFDDNNPCTRDVCIEDEAGNTDEVHFDVPDGNACEAEGIENGICLTGTCVESTCGDGFADDRDYDGDGNPDEECDDGDDNADAADACKTDCQAPAVGDGFIDTTLGEVCDDGNEVNEDGCTLEGKVNYCGDGIPNHVINPATGREFEECDDGADDSDFDACKANCEWNVCGDGKVNPAAEACDDGNINPSDGCNQCRRTEWVPEVIFGLGDGEGNKETLPLGSPGPMAIDRNGNVFWSEVATSVLRRFDKNEQKVTLYAGDSSPTFHGDNGPATRAGVAGIFGIAIDGKDNVYISDFEDHRVRKIDGRTGVISTIAGVGRAGYSGDNGPAIFAQFNHPQGIDVDGVGNVYIADKDNNVVRKIDAKTGIISTIAGHYVPDYCYTSHFEEPALTTDLCSPEDVKVAPNGDVYIAEGGGHQIRKLVVETNTVVTVAGHYFYQTEDDVNPNPHNATSQALGRPLQIALDRAGENLFMTCRNNNVVRHLDLQSGIIRNIGCDQREPGGYDPTDNGQLATDAWCDYPTGLVVNDDGEVLFSDQYNHLIRKLVPDGNGYYTIENFIGADDVADPLDINDAAVLFPVLFRLAPGALGLQFSRPVDKQDLSQGAMLNIPQSCGDNNPVTSCTAGYGVADYPIAIAEERSNRIFIRLGDVNVITLAGTGERDYYGDGLKGDLAAFNRPSGVAMSLERLPVRLSNDPFIVDEGGLRSTVFPRYIYVADTGNHVVRRIELEGEQACCNRDGVDEVYMNQVGNHVVTTVIGTGEPGISARDGDAATFQLNSPAGITALSNGHILVSDTENHRIVEYDPDNGQVRTILGKVISPVAGVFESEPGYVAFGTSANHPDLGNNVEMNSPHALTALPMQTIDPLGTGDIVFYADRGNQRARLYLAGTFAPTSPLATFSEVVTDIAGSGTRGYSGDEGPAHMANLEYPQAVMPHVDSACLSGDNTGDECAPKVLVAEGPDRVRIVSLQLGGAGGISGNIDTLLGDKEPQYDGTFDVATMRAPVGMTPVGDELGSWLFTDDALGTVRTFSFGTQTLETVAGFPKGFEDGETDQKAQYMRELEEPGKIILNPARNEAYVAEAGRHVVRRVSADGGSLDFRGATTSMSVLLGVADEPGSTDGTFAEARLNEPYGLALDIENQILFISERGNHTVRAVQLDNTSAADAVRTIAGRSGIRGNFGDGGEATSALLNEPRGVAFSAGKGLYIADTANHRVRRIADPIAAGAVIEGVLGDSSPASSGEGEGAASFPVDTPVGLELDNNGNLFVTSRTAVRVVSSGEDGIATGADRVDTIYGKATERRFPEPVTRCVDSLRFSTENFNELYLMDSCQGYFVRLRRQNREFTPATP